MDLTGKLRRLFGSKREDKGEDLGVLPRVYWQEFQKRFEMDPRGAHGFLNDREIEYSSEYCKSWPKTLVINMTAVCNILCRFCGQTQFQKEYQAGHNLSFMDSEKLKIIFRDIDMGYPMHVDLQGDGEPLIQRDFKKVYRFCREKFPFSAMRVCSNGVALTRAMSDFLLEGKLAWLNVSLNAGSEEVHEKVTGTKVFSRIVSNIGYLQKQKKKCGSHSPGIGMSYVLARFNLDDMENFVRLCADLEVKDAQIHYMTVVSQEMFDASVIHEKYRTNKALERAAKLAADLGINLNIPPLFEILNEGNEKEPPPIPGFDFETRRKEIVSARQEALANDLCEKPSGSGLGVLEERHLIKTKAAFRCTYPWDFISLRGNGDAQMCCGAIGYEAGNLIDQGFWEIWNGPIRRFLRRTVNSGMVDRICNVCPLNRVRDVSKPETHVRPGVISATG